MVSTLINFGTGVNDAGGDGRTVLHSAYEYTKKVVDLLVDLLVDAERRC